MPRALIVALVVSIGLHLALLFGAEIDLTPASEPLQILAELRPMPKPAVKAETEEKASKPIARKSNKPRRQAQSVASAASVLSVPVASTEAVSPATEPMASSNPSPEPTPSAEPVAVPSAARVESRFPPRGIIHYRVDKGDSNFEVGRATQEWEIADGRYRLTSVIETTGIAWLFKAYRIEMESRGAMTQGGFQPERFILRRNGKEPTEQAFFDWASMTIRVGNRSPQALDEGAQDLLSFSYQLGYMAHPDSWSTLHLTNGKKYSTYLLEVFGDEEIEVPAGKFRTLHLRAPGDSTDELWLAYDYLLLPVKIRHVDVKGGSLVQVATQIQLSQPSPP